MSFDLATTPRRFISAAQLADYLECDPRTIIALIRNKSLEGLKVGRSWRIPTEAACAAFHVPRATKHAS